MKEILLPDNYNYVAAFLTLRCNLNCSYCINKHGDFIVPKEMSGAEWIKGLSRISTRKDLPITLQGGEPTIHKDFYEIANGLKGQHLDLLTNGKFSMDKFINNIKPDIFKRGAKYASIRFSYHKGMGVMELVSDVWLLKTLGYEVGIWGLSNNDNQAMADKCKWLGIDFRVKEYLDKDHGTYKYPDALSGKLKTVFCKPSEMLINPSGYIFRCHSDLYANRTPIGHILDEEIIFPDYLSCDYYGLCNPCDVKLKTNRLQEYGHCSVTIKEKDERQMATG